MVGTLREVIDSSLDQAVKNWSQVGGELLEKLSKRVDALPSLVPGHSAVDERRAKIDTFIALVADMRESSKHLLQAISTKGEGPRASQLERVYYETSALLPGLAWAVKAEDGAVTEYLGDGILALFSVDADPQSDIRRAFRAARMCVRQVRAGVNDAIYERFRLPPIDIGVGLAMSKAIVQRIGLPGQMHAKVIGECVYRATKLSNGRNVVFVDAALRHAWPKSRGGKLTFREKRSAAFDAYEVLLDV